MQGRKVVETVRRRAPCPRCGRSARRTEIRSRRVIDLGGQHVIFRYSRHRCRECRWIFTPAVLGGRPRSRYAPRVRALVVRLRRRGWTFRRIREALATRWKIRLSLYTLAEWTSDLTLEAIQ